MASLQNISNSFDRSIFNVFFGFKSMFLGSIATAVFLAKNWIENVLVLPCLHQESQLQNFWTWSKVKVLILQRSWGSPGILPPPQTVQPLRLLRAGIRWWRIVETNLKTILLSISFCKKNIEKLRSWNISRTIVFLSWTMWFPSPPKNFSSRNKIHFVCEVVCLFQVARRGN